MKNMKKAQFGALIKAGAKAAVKKAPRTAKSAFKTKQLKEGLNNALIRNFHHLKKILNLQLEMLEEKT